jgi:NADH:ubiquinone oxidoreductase subunit E
MKTLAVCVGSSCHLLGSYEVIRKLQKLIEEHHLTNEVELKASFCLGKCQAGVTVCYEDTIYTALTQANIGEFFHKHVLGGGEKLTGEERDDGDYLND